MVQRIKTTMVAAFLTTLSVAMPHGLQASSCTFLPPTMGWCAWNSYGVHINEQNICAQVDAMVRLGLDKAGYKYINIDDGYWNGRAESGVVRIDHKKFPHGLKYVTDYIHSKNLKAGIYSDAGDNTCASQNIQAWGLGVGLAGHEYEDCKLYFNDYGYDFIKVDYCGGNNMGLDERRQYTKIGEAIKRCEKETGKRIIYNVCRWNFPGTWVCSIADSWRTNGDIIPSWEDDKERPWGKGLKSIIKRALYEQAYTGGGHYNDMDQLVIGHGLNSAEARTHFSVWCIDSSPLLIGSDLTRLTDDDIELLTNSDLLAMNQDCLGQGAPVVQREGEVYVLAKDMMQKHGEQRAALVINLSNREQTIEVCLQRIGFIGKVNVHDCFTKTDTNVKGKTMQVTVPAHGTQAFFLIGQRCDKTTYQAEEAWLNGYQQLSSIPTATPAEATTASQGVMVENIGNKDTNYLEWKDVYVSKAGKYKLTIAYASAKHRDMKVMVNGRDAKVFTGLNTGSWNNQWLSCSLIVSLKAGSNNVRIGNTEGFTPNIDYMRVEAE